MFFVYGLFLAFGVALFLLGLGFTARWLGYMIRGVGMGWGVIFYLILLGTFGLLIGSLMVPYYWDLVYSSFR